MPFDDKGRYYEAGEPKPEWEVASAARTTSGTGTAFAVGGYEAVRGRLNITAVGGTPNAVVSLDVSFDDGSTFETASGNAWPAKTGTGQDTNIFNVSLATHARWAWTITGSTPSVTFAIDQVVGERQHA